MKKLIEENEMDNETSKKNFLYGVFTITLAFLLMTSAGMAKDSNKWRLEFGGKAHSDGVIVLKITPVDGSPINVNIEVADGTSENGVAKVVRDALRAQLPEKAFHIERDDGEDVLIKKRWGASDFNVEIVSSTVEHVSIHLEVE
jgi:hypothetical protein